MSIDNNLRNWKYVMAKTLRLQQQKHAKEKNDTVNWCIWGPVHVAVVFVTQLHPASISALKRLI